MTRLLAFSALCLAMACGDSDSPNVKGARVEVTNASTNCRQQDPMPTERKATLVVTCETGSTSSYTGVFACTDALTFADVDACDLASLSLTIEENGLDGVARVFTARNQGLQSDETAYLEFWEALPAVLGLSVNKVGPTSVDLGCAYNHCGPPGTSNLPFYYSTLYNEDRTQIQPGVHTALNLWEGLTPNTTYYAEFRTNYCTPVGITFTTLPEP